MTYDDHYSPDAINARALEKQREDFDDLQNELAGRDNTGRIQRFLFEDDERSATGRAKKERQDHTFRLHLLLSDPAYSALYNETMSAVTDAESAVYDALVESADKLQDTGDALADAIERGASTEEIAQLQKEHDDAKERHRRMQEYEAELAAIRARMEDKDNPPSKEELAEFEGRSRAIKRDALSVRHQGKELEVDRSNVEADFDLGLGPAPAP